MANDRKLLTADFKNLKAKVKAEMLRRQYQGSVTAYGSATYDYASAPTDNGPVLGEHLKKNLDPMNAVNGDGLPVYPGELTKAGQDLMETKINAWATRSITDRASSDCKSGCTGTCHTTCQTGCYTGCTDSCSGCGSGCAGGCSGCGSGCAGGCSGCGSGCAGGCSGCGSGCAGGCQGCGGACSSGCGNGCGSSCSGGGD